MFRKGDRVSAHGFGAVVFGSEEGLVLGACPGGHIVKWDDGVISKHSANGLFRISQEYRQPGPSLESFSKGEKVQLGNGSEGIVEKKVERSGYESYKVRITKSLDPEQKGSTIFATPDGMKKMSVKCVKLGNNLLECELADNPKKQELGLQAYAELEEGQGMYFSFDIPRSATFHMGCVQFPIDMVGVSDGKVAKIVSDIQPGDPQIWKFFNVEGVLEVRGGFCDEYDIEVGSNFEMLAEAQSYDLLRTSTEAQHVPGTVDLPYGESAIPDIRTESDAKVYLSRAFGKGMPNPDRVAKDLLDAYEYRNDGNWPNVRELERILMEPDYREIWLYPIADADNKGLLPGYTGKGGGFGRAEIYQAAFRTMVVSQLSKEMKSRAQQMGFSLNDLGLASKAQRGLGETYKNPYEQSLPSQKTDNDRYPGDCRRTPPSQQFVDRQIPEEFVPDSKNQEQNIGYSPLKETEYAVRPSGRKTAQLVMEVYPSSDRNLREFLRSDIGLASVRLAGCFEEGVSHSELQSHWQELTSKMDIWQKDALVHGLVGVGYDAALDFLKY